MLKKVAKFTGLKRFHELVKSTISRKKLKEKPIRVGFYIDGFNVYHHIRRMNKPMFKWINYRKLCQFFISSENHEIVCIKMFTTPPIHMPGDVQNRHKLFQEVQSNYCGVELILGKFKQQTHQVQEKQTDINMAVNIIDDAVEDKVDLICIMTNDSDFVPVINFIKDKTDKKIKIITPPYARTSYDLTLAMLHFYELDRQGTINKNNTNHKKLKISKIRDFHLMKAILPNEFEHRGKKYKCPYLNWDHERGFKASQIPEMPSYEDPS